jgi:hypothetical protein
VDNNLPKKNLLYVLLPLLLVLISLFLCFKNYSPGTFLTGWDTLHPEFNYKIYWKRIIFGAWQSHQGLGAVTSQAHASEIPRIAFISLLNLFLATDKIRYLYAFLMLILGPLGVYFYIEKIIFRENNDKFSAIGAFSGGLFYLLNLGTLQHFNVPLEMFLTHYGFLGWSFLFLTEFYLKGERKDLIKFILVSFFITSQAHTPTLFYVYFSSIVIYLTTLLLGEISFNKKGNSSGNSHTNYQLKRSVIIVMITLIINMFWLLPNVYYGVVKGKEVPLSKIHRLFSEEAFLVNKKYGTIKDIAILKNFLFDWGVYAGDDYFVDLLEPWIIHLRKPLVISFGYGIFLLTLSGVVVAIIKKNIYAISWLMLGIVSVFFIINVNPPSGFIFKFFQDNIPLFKELFRFPFTKFSILLMFTYAVFFGYFLSFLSQFLDKRLGKLVPFIILFIVTVGLFYFSLPAFKGNLINRSMRVDIPDRYFEMFKYFDSQTEYGRVATLPIHTFWGWVSHSWDSKGTGYQGAGFLWFGIKQPLIDREFDRWNIANEQPYRELSTAVYSEDSVLLQKTLEKYKIRWLIFDKSVVGPGLDTKVLFYDEIPDLLLNVPGIKLDKDFGGGLVVYKYIPQTDYSKIEVLSNYFVVDNTLFKEYLDPIYTKYGNYINGDGVKYSFLGFNSVDENMDANLVSSDETSVNFKLSDNTGGNLGTISNIEKIPVQLFLRETDIGRSVEVLFSGISISKIPLSSINMGPNLIRINNEVFDISNISKDSFIGSLLISPNSSLAAGMYSLGEGVKVDNFSYLNLENCDILESGNASAYSMSKVEGGFQITARDTLACFTMPLSDTLAVTKSDLVLVSFKSDNSINADDFCILDNSLGLCIDVFTKGDYFFAKLDKDVKNYSLRFFVDARNSKTDLSKTYTNVVISSASLVSENNVNVEMPDEAKTVNNLTFSKKDQFTMSPAEILGNRRSCMKGVGVEDVNFVSSDKGIVFNSTKGSLCDSYSFPLASHNTGYVLEVRAVYSDGVPLRLCLTNEYSKRCDLDVSLPADKSGNTHFFIVPPMGKGIGYTLNVSNYVFGDTQSKNELQYISLVPISFNLVKNIKVEDLTSTSGNLYVLNEAYDSGWLAICNWRICTAKHVKVNNWANGWAFEDTIPNDVKTVFWPQLLEFIGFIAWVPVVALSFKYKEKDVLEQK